MVSYPSRRERERQMREAELIAAAEKIFYQKGYDEASMDEIAQEAEFTKKTLYQYFNNKKELYFAVACKGFQALLEYLQSANQTECNGFEKMRLFTLAYYRFYQDYPYFFRLIKYCPMPGMNEEGSPYYQKLEDIKAFMVQILVDTIEKGKKDRSIRRNLDSRMAAQSLIFFSTGFFYRLSEIGKRFEFKVSQIFENGSASNQEEFIRFSLELLCNTLAPLK